MKKLMAAVLLFGFAGILCASIINGFFDITVMSAPAVPASGNARLYIDSTSNTLSCLLHSGASCMPGTAASVKTRACVIDNDTQSSTALTSANLSGACTVPVASTITEIDVWGGTGTTGGTLSTTGTSSVNLQRYTPNGGSTATVLSGALATASGQACALTATSGTCGNGTTSSSSITVSTTSLSAGDWVRISAATADGTQTWYRVAVIYTIN